MKVSEFKLLDVKLILSSGNKFNILYENCEEKDFDIKENEGSYSIIQKNKLRKIKKILFNFSLSSNDAVIKVTLPDNLDLINIKSKNNSILLDNIYTDTISIFLENGNIKMKNIESNTVDIICKNGTLKFSKLEIKKILDVNLENGVLRLDSKDNDNIKYNVKCENGIVNNKYQNFNAIGDIEYNLKCGNGIITIS